MQMKQTSSDYYRIEKAIRFLVENKGDQPDLALLAQEAGISPHHFQKLFLRWAGITPKQFLKYLTKEYAKQLLERSNVLESSYASGLSGPGRLHDLMVTCEAVTPGEFRSKGKGVIIHYGFHPTPFGGCFIATTDRGICALFFLDEITKQKIPDDFLKAWKNAKMLHDQKRTLGYVSRIFPSGKIKDLKPLRLLCRGTNFQVKVWEALLRIPFARVVTYRDVAKMASKPRAIRAAGTAIGQNPVAYLIPCHRVIRGLGTLGGYRWGEVRKRLLLGMEVAKKERI